ncbi:MAG: SH3 domain-containing protein [Anaerolineae bacterium]|nr:SH3 domain-containing protein [Anaerolineae bacterium]
MQAATVREEINGAFNVANPSQPAPPNTSDAGWIYTATQTYTLGRIEFRFANTNGVAIGIDIYNNAPALGGVLLATGTFTPVGGNVWEGTDLSAQIPVTAGQTLFIGVRDFYSSPTTNAGGAAAFPLYFSTTPSNYGTNGTAFNNLFRPIMRLIETQATFTIGDVTVTEGNAGTVNAVFAVTRAGDINTAVSVDFATADVSATAGVDYVANAGTLNFGVGVLTQNVTVVVNGDVAFEGDETFNVNLNNPSAGAVITDGQGVGTITNDDIVPTFTINDVTVTEGNAGTVNAVFTVTRAGDLAGTNAVDFATANVSATAGVDYIANAGTLIFGPTVAAQTVTVVVNGDVLFEGDETFNVNLNNPTNGAAITDNQGVGTITNDDGAPTFTINDVTVTEGNAGTVNAVFTVTRAGDLSGTNAVDFTTADVSATAGVDYVGNAGTLTFGPTVAAQTITVVVNGDAIFEGDETFNVNLNNATNGAIITDNQGVGTITNDDVPPGLSVNSVTVSEAAGAGNFTVTLNPADAVNVTVDYTITDGTAANGVDYTAVMNGTLTFIAGDTAETIPFALIDNVLIDGSRAFTVTLNNSSGPVITVGTGTATITDDESLPPPPVVVVPVVVSFPPPPPVPLCADFNGTTNTAVRANIPPGVFGVHCRMIAEDGIFIRSAAEVGVQGVLDQGVVQAVDVFSPSNANAAGSLICLRGTGSIIFLASNAAPRTPQVLPVSVQGGYTCATIPGTGIVVLVGSAASPAAASTTTAASSIALTDCRVTTTHQVRLREQPSSDSAVLTTLPYDVSYTATARAGEWIQVIESNRQGWVSATYLNTSGSCG